jgi:hypothetical protein
MTTASEEVPEWERPEMLKKINTELAEQLSQAEAAADPEVLAYLRKLEARVKELETLHDGGICERLSNSADRPMPVYDEPAHSLGPERLA